MAAVVTPAAFLADLVGHRVVVKSKWGPQFEATLISTDNYMNVHLKDCIEHVSGASEPNAGGDDEEGVSVLGEVLIRCNNILHIRGVPDGQKPTFVPW